ncbi:TfoX/Sxy family protein [Enterobacter asburiae]|uniref:TfoX/Sxy family protein n=1 Tax=Enterobacter asburiae TaxID=61645 RepID=UPI002075DE79|nr:TfoX/Sxy family protein [Enterobacter asburiae]MCM7669325.1 TfoX/Sxy family protein [Enterobacter asburiae]HCR2106161.1 hypothetical protein [Enterobacter asburiae]
MASKNTRHHAQTRATPGLQEKVVASGGEFLYRMCGGVVIYWFIPPDVCFSIIITTRHHITKKLNINSVLLMVASVVASVVASAKWPPFLATRHHTQPIKSPDI